VLLVLGLFLAWQTRRAERARAEEALRTVEVSQAVHDKERLAVLRDRVRVLTAGFKNEAGAGRTREELRDSPDPEVRARGQELRDAEEEMKGILRRHPGWDE
jgi:hypothetical protein